MKGKNKAKASKHQAAEKFIDLLQTELDEPVFHRGQKLYQYANVQVLTQGNTFFEFEVEDEYQDYKVSVKITDSPDEEINYRFEARCNCKENEYCSHRVAAIFEMKDLLKIRQNIIAPAGKQYTREGMIQRVLEERRHKSLAERYRLRFSDNIWGEHILTTEKGKTYKLTFRNLEKEQGYCSCPDYQSNKLGTCKHLMYAFNALKQQKKAPRDLDYPFIDVFLDPLNEYKISYFYPHTLSPELKSLFDKYFDPEKVFKGKKNQLFLQFSKEVKDIKSIKIRPEVFDLVEEAFEDEIIEQVKQKNKVHFSAVKAELFPYQKKGVEFAVFKKACIIADEMGLGKTLQAITVALLKKEFFGFEKTLVICPASLKEQ